MKDGGGVRAAPIKTRSSLTKGQAGENFGLLSLTRAATLVIQKSLSDLNLESTRRRYPVLEFIAVVS